MYDVVKSFGDLDELLTAFGAKQTPIAETKSRQEIARDYRLNQNKKRSQRRIKAKKQYIAILDMETDPFDNETRLVIVPFVACLYTEEHGANVIWENDEDVFIDRVISAISNLPNSYTVFAHNGGKFDYMFLIHKLRGKVSFKGRGIMSATIGDHNLRDSYHIIPEKLANLQKQKFDYTKLLRDKRHKYRQEIIDYLISDCTNLLFYVKRFIEKAGFKISIGAAALSKLREHYEIESVSETTDAYLRDYFFGGRVECLQGARHYRQDFKLYDINSAYPDAMANKPHPVGSEYIKRSGHPNDQTAFIKLECDNKGALVSRMANDEGIIETTSRQRSGVFFTTIWEYETALELELIKNVNIIECVDNLNWTTFDKFVLPLYAGRQEKKMHMASLIEGSNEWNLTNADQTIDKLFMNNAYGKTAQNPRHFKEHWFTDPGEFPPPESMKLGEDGWELKFNGATHWIWERPSQKWRFLNVGTGASITGAVRAKLMRAIAMSVNPIYCDTDSIICEELVGEKLHKTDLGAWDIEKEISEVVLCGKKLYAYRHSKGDTIRSKGATGLTFDDMVNIYAGDNVISVNFAPTLTKTGKQDYMERTVRRTAKLPA